MKHVDYEKTMIMQAARGGYGRPLRDDAHCLICRWWRKPCPACQRPRTVGRGSVLGRRLILMPCSGRSSTACGGMVATTGMSCKKRGRALHRTFENSRNPPLKRLWNRIDLGLAVRAQDD
jgi:hypothetical protein